MDSGFRCPATYLSSSIVCCLEARRTIGTCSWFNEKVIYHSERRIKIISNTKKTATEIRTRNAPVSF